LVGHQEVVQELIVQLSELGRHQLLDPAVHQVLHLVPEQGRRLLVYQ
jgi:hypothetical protein